MDFYTLTQISGSAPYIQKCHLVQKLLVCCSKQTADKYLLHTDKNLPFSGVKSKALGSREICVDHGHAVFAVRRADKNLLPYVISKVPVPWHPVFCHLFDDWKKIGQWLAIFFFLPRYTHTHTDTHTHVHTHTHTHTHHTHTHHTTPHHTTPLPPPQNWYHACTSKYIWTLSIQSCWKYQSQFLSCFNLPLKAKKNNNNLISEKKNISNIIITLFQAQFYLMECFSVGFKYSITTVIKLNHNKNLSVCK